MISSVDAASRQAHLHVELRCVVVRSTAAMHAGVDIPGALGTPIYATAGSVISHAGRPGRLWQSSSRSIAGRGIETRYGHPRKILVADNSRVKRGQPADRPRARPAVRPAATFTSEVRVDGKAVNPIPFLQTGEYLVAVQDRGDRQLSAVRRRTSRKADWSREEGCPCRQPPFITSGPTALSGPTPISRRHGAHFRIWAAGEAGRPGEGMRHPEFPARIVGGPECRRLSRILERPMNSRLRAKSRSPIWPRRWPGIATGWVCDRLVGQALGLAGVSRRG